MNNRRDVAEPAQEKIDAAIIPTSSLGANVAAWKATSTNMVAHPPSLLEQAGTVKSE